METAIVLLSQYGKIRAMRRISTVTLLLSFCLAFANLSAGGGPDAYGYTWLGSFDSGGPTYNYIDPDSAWVKVSGLLDDNSVGPVNMGWSFHYYWQDFNTIKLGSNGWLGFDNTSNIAHCFPKIPDATPGGQAHNFLAPMMSDLNFAAGPGEMYWYSNWVDTFIVAWVNVPFWSAGGQGYTGSMTFEVILSGVDSSITYQYKNMNATVPVNACLQDVEIGIESPTGQHGLEVYNEIIPTNGTAIKFYYPDSVLISIYDAKPAWNMNTENGGVFFGQGLVTLNTNVANVGNSDITSPISVTSRVLDIFNTQIHTVSDTVSALLEGADTTIIQATQANLQNVGQYYFETGITNTQDINSGNDTNITEIDIVNLTFSTAQLSYSTGTINTGTISWQGGDTTDGLGVYIEPPVYPCDIVSIDYYIASATNGFIARVFDNTGTGGSPGAMLYDSTIAVPTTGWYTVTLASPITIQSGGVYLAWMMGGAGASLGTENTGPKSRRGFEILSGGWTEYRQNKTEEVMIRMNIGNYSCLPTAAFSHTTNLANAIFTNSSGAGQFYQWDFDDGTTDSTANPIHTFAAAGNYNVCLITTNSCGSDTVCDTVAVCFKPTAGFGYTQNANTVQFQDSTIGGATQWFWDYGDGGTNNIQNPAHFYTVIDTYTVCLHVYNGCEWDTLCQDIYMCPPPASGFGYTITGSTVTFADSATGNPTSYTWYFGNGDSSNLSSPTYTYTASGSYTVCQVATNSCGDDSTCVTISVAVGIEEEVFGDLKLFPNPTSGQFRISGEGKFADGMTVSLVNSLGQTVKRIGTRPSAGKFDIDIPVSDLSSGIYFVALRAGDVLVVRQLVIE